jgi:hypothetical protein
VTAVRKENPDIVKQTLRPGLLVSLKTSVRGNVSYDKKIVEESHITEDGAAAEAWETKRTIVDPKEHERAQKAMSLARNAIRRVCAHSAFGYLCPEADSDKLDAGVAEARKIVEAFNQTAQLTRLSVNVITGRIAPDDVEAIKSINSEIKDLMDAMESGVQNLDVRVIREAATKAKDVAAMLNKDSQARVQIAVDAARNAAKAIVKAGETAAVEVDRQAVRLITEQRTAFLDLDEPAQVQAPVAQSVRAVDLAPAVPATAIKPRRKARIAEVE